MSQDIISPEECAFLASIYNMEINQYIGKVKDKNDFNNKTEMGISTTIIYKKPFFYNLKHFESIRVVSYILDKQKAKTNVWATPKNKRALDEQLLTDFSLEYEPFKLPQIHSEIVEKIKEYHLNLHKEGFYLEDSSKNEELIF